MSKFCGNGLAMTVSLLCGIFLLAGCGTYVPSGSTVVKITNTKHKFDRASLMPVNNELSRHVIKMKWYNENTFLTTGVLNGDYSFRARNYEGAAISRNIAFNKDEDYYEVDAGRREADAVSLEGPEVRGRITRVRPGTPVQSVAVLFIGKEVVLKTAPVSRDGEFKTNAPSKGNWRIEAHLLGEDPQSYSHDTINITGPVNLGNVVLK